ncbi:DUF805 domain-containing protein [Ligilactobacillus araffinosus]|uniref:DUF805 domain-containing protein n=1 Tax=Ligilactobacillus araffinosus DSM 20653 TaxID=1423820 RepID=A0A0R1ZN30_9LACO|nr:DUF805 domain-containing protein [Ligilactobacillus araffinosus]KRM53243.1 hypothetical protein FC64_GL000814 [Ligilactobacillus araffinosus DSM 20653]
MKKIEEKGRVMFEDAVSDYWHGLFSFGGRSTRSGYWWSVFNYFATIYFLGLATILLTFLSFGSALIIVVFGLVGCMIAMLIGNLAVIFRRLRDVGLKTVPIVILNVLIFVLPIIGVIATHGSALALANVSTLIGLIVGIIIFIFTLLPTDQFVAEKENWLVRGKDTVDETQTTVDAQPQLTKAAPAANTTLPTVVFYPDGREQEIK